MDFNRSAFWNKANKNVSFKLTVLITQLHSIRSKNEKNHDFHWIGKFTNTSPINEKDENYPKTKKLLEKRMQ